MRFSSSDALVLNAFIVCVFTTFVSSLTTVPELIKKRGYPCEEHHVVTKDGYILTLFRIYKSHWFKSTPPVIMQHGLLSSSATWVLSTPHKSPAFLLVDAGYDVWLPNARGSIYSRNHTELNPTSYDFWNFSWDEMAEFDFPAFIDYVLHKTGYSSVTYIGHSMGTTMYFAGMNYHPTYNSKIKSMYALGPVAMVGHMESEIRVVSYVENIIKYFLLLFRQYEIMPEDSWVMKLTRIGCNAFSVNRFICSNLLFVVTGFDSSQFKYAWIDKASDELLSGTSINTVIHYGQEYRSKRFRKFDFGFFHNKRKYGQHTPPNYDLKMITSEVNLIWGDNDYLADPKDMKYLSNNLPNLGRASGAVKDLKFNHLDFLWAPEAKKMVYDKIINDMKSR